MKYPIVKAKDANGVEFLAYEAKVDGGILHVDKELADMYRLGYEAFVEKEISLLKRTVA